MVVRIRGSHKSHACSGCFAETVLGAASDAYSLYFSATAQADEPTATASRGSPLFEAALDCIPQGFSSYKQTSPGGPTRQ